MRTKLDIYDFIQQSTEILSRKTTFYGHKTFEDKLCTVKPVLRGYRWDK